MSAANHADVLFVKRTVTGESDLERYCKTLGIRHIVIKTFYSAAAAADDPSEAGSDIKATTGALDIIRAITNGQMSIEDAFRRYGADMP